MTDRTRYLLRAPVFTCGLLVLAFVLFVWADSMRYETSASAGDDYTSLGRLTITSSGSAIQLRRSRIECTDPSNPLPHSPDPFFYERNKLRDPDKQWLPSATWNSPPPQQMETYGSTAGPTFWFRDQYGQLPYSLLAGLSSILWYALLRRRLRKWRQQGGPGSPSAFGSSNQNRAR